MTGYVRSHPEKFNLHWIPAPAEIDRDDVRLTIDIEEDWDHALLLFEALGDERFDWRRITSLLDHQPGMRRRMAALNRALCACVKGEKGWHVPGAAKGVVSPAATPFAASRTCHPRVINSL